MSTADAILKPGQIRGLIELVRKRGAQVGEWEVGFFACHLGEVGEDKAQVGRSSSGSTRRPCFDLGGLAMTGGSNGRRSDGADAVGLQGDSIQ